MGNTYHCVLVRISIVLNTSFVQIHKLHYIVPCSISTDGIKPIVKYHVT